MKAVGYYQSLPIDHPDALLDLELPEPTPGPRDLLVEVRAISVNPVDTKVRQRAQPEAGQAKVLGWDAAGVVRAVGSEVSLFRPGDRVWYAGDITRPGSNSELHRVDERIAGHLPKSLDFAQAAALPLTTITAWELLFERLQIAEGKADQGQSLLVVGAAGGVGSILVQLARQLTGLNVIGTASRAETQAWVRDLGAHHVIDHGKPLAEELKRIGIAEVSHVASLTHTDQHLEQIVAALRPQGRLALIDDPAVAGHRQAEAEEPVAALGVHVHPLDVPDRRHDRAAPAAGAGRRADRRRRVEDHRRRAFRPHRRGQPAPRPRAAGERPGQGQDRSRRVLNGRTTGRGVFHPTAVPLAFAIPPCAPSAQPRSRQGSSGRRWSMAPRSPRHRRSCAAPRGGSSRSGSSAAA